MVTVFWGTNRNSSDTPNIAKSGDKSNVQKASFSLGHVSAKKLELGYAYVSIPKVGREAGTIQRPRQYAYLFTEREDINKHFTVAGLGKLGRDHFNESADYHQSKAARFRDQAFIFIHGYNTTFEDALYRTAQIAHDLEFDGVPYLFSWPSRGEAKGYMYDKDTAEAAQGYFGDFLRHISQQKRVKRVNIIAHSMGNRVFLETLKVTPPKGLKIDQIILAAPDIDRQVFEQIAERVRAAGRGVTLYASKTDRALIASRELSLGSPRAGDVPPKGGPLVVAGIDTIDISDAGDAFWSTNHSVFAERSHVLTDIKLLMQDGVRPPDKRFPVFKRVAMPTGAYWQYVRN